MSRRQAVGLLFITVLLWSTSGVLIKLLPWNALAITGARSAITAVVIWSYVRKPKFTWSSAQIGGAITSMLMSILFIAATQLTTAANAIFLQYSAPVFVALFGAWYLGERARPVDWLAMAAIIGGMFLFLLDGLSAGGLLGSLLAILAGVCMAWMMLFMRKQKDDSPIETILLGTLLGAAIGFPFLVWEVLYGPPLERQGVGIMLFLGVFQLGIPYILYAQTVRVLTAVRTALILSLEPILNPIWVFLIIGERPGTLALLGGAIVFTTVTLTAVYTARQERLTPQTVVAS